MIFDVNNAAMLQYMKDLDKMSRSAYPVAIRSALNSAAFDTKQRTLQKTTSIDFTNRQKNFFKAFSKVEMAQGFDINTMQATIGMVEDGLKGGRNYAVKDLQAQEAGGSIGGKSFIPTKYARSGANNSKPVRPGNRLSGIKKIVDAKKAKGVNDRQKFVKSVYFAGKGGYVLADHVLWRVNSLNKTDSGSFKLTPLYSYQPGRNVSVRPTGFMSQAALMSGSQMDIYFIEAAQKQFAKLFK